MLTHILKRRQSFCVCYFGKIHSLEPFFVCRFESCWPAIAKDTNGVLFVYNPDQGSHGQDLAKW